MFFSHAPNTPTRPQPSASCCCSLIHRLRFPSWGARRCLTAAPSAEERRPAQHRPAELLERRAGAACHLGRLGCPVALLAGPENLIAPTAAPSEVLAGQDQGLLVLQRGHQQNPRPAPPQERSMKLEQVAAGAERIPAGRLPSLSMKLRGMQRMHRPWHLAGRLHPHQILR